MNWTRRFRSPSDLIPDGVGTMYVIAGSKSTWNPIIRISADLRQRYVLTERSIHHHLTCLHPTSHGLVPWQPFFKYKAICMHSRSAHCLHAGGASSFDVHCLPEATIFGCCTCTCVCIWQGQSAACTCLQNRYDIRKQVIIRIHTATHMQVQMHSTENDVQLIDSMQYSKSHHSAETVPHSAF